VLESTNRRAGERESESERMNEAHWTCQPADGLQCGQVELWVGERVWVGLPKQEYRKLQC
jgi:hypothetical protein